MGQQHTAAGSSTLLRRSIVALTVAAIMALTASPAFAGNGEAKGQDGSNPGKVVNDKVGDAKNNAANVQCDPFEGGASNSPNGSGCSNN